MRWPRSLAGGDRAGVGLVETAGGACSPQAADGDAVALARLLRPDLLVLVADAGLGTLHAVRACLPALAGAGTPGRRPRTVVVLNRYDPGAALHRRNLDWLSRHHTLAPVVLPGGEDRLAAEAVGARPPAPQDPSRAVPGSSYPRGPASW